MEAGWSTTLFALALAVAACASDVKLGRQLYETHCIACHRGDRHDRIDSRVATYSDLRFEVDRWTARSGRQFTAAEREQLVEYLDATHYRLDRPTLRR